MRYGDADGGALGTFAPQMPQPLPVAAIIPAHNRADEIRRAVRSALDQRPDPPAEVIVIDDASDDDTAAVAEAEGARVVRLAANVGAAGARNAGVAATSQPWVAFLDSDDEWLPHHLATLWPHTRQFDVVASAALRTGTGPLVGRRHGSLHRRGEILTDPGPILFPENPIPLSASLVRRARFDAAGGFDETLRYSEDFDLWLRLVDACPVRLISDVTVLYHLHGGQKSGNRVPLRAVQDRIVEQCHARSSWRPEYGGQRATVVAWDDLQAARRNHDRHAAVGAGRSLASNPVRWRYLLAVWVYRRRLRRLSARWTPDGSAVAARISLPPHLHELVGLLRRPAGSVTAEWRWVQDPPASS